MHLHSSLGWEAWSSQNPGTVVCEENSVLLRKTQSPGKDC